MKPDESEHAQNCKFSLVIVSGYMLRVAEAVLQKMKIVVTLLYLLALHWTVNAQSGSHLLNQL